MWALAVTPSKCKWTGRGEGEEEEAGRVKRAEEDEDGEKDVGGDAVQADDEGGAETETEGTEDDDAHIDSTCHMKRAVLQFAQRL